MPWLKKEAVFLILPIIFWTLKLSIGRPAEGSYSDYNVFVSLDKNFLPSFIQNSWQFIVYGFFWPIVAPLTILPRKIFAGILMIIGGIFYVLTKKTLLLQDNGRDFSLKTYLGFGFLLFLLGITPYLAVNKAPHVFGNGFAMRHTLLLPLGSSLVILGVILATVKEKWQLTVQMALLALFSVFTIFNYYLQDMDWYKQRAIIESLKETKNEEIISATSLIFYDKMGNNWQNRNVRGEEYFGYIQNAFTREKLKFTASEEHDTVKNYYANPINSRSFQTGFDPAKKVVRVEIVSRAKREITTVKNWLKIKRAEVFSNQPSFLQNVKDIYQIEVIPF
jgi:Ca2+/Na+ antiporter